ncbi:MAG: NADH-quinone oxidoreductase subunit C [Dasania sp.]|jgi:NADH-quinone oxidoreductase subunit C
MKLSVEKLQERLKARPEVITSHITCGELAVTINPQTIVSFLIYLRDDKNLRFLQLVDLCGVDYPERQKRFDVVYHLLSLHYNVRLRIKMAVGEDDIIPSIVNVYPAADWNEREAFDMYGITFSGHPDMRRILTDYGFSGYPLRKDFPTTGYVELRYDVEQKRVVYEPVKLTQDFRQFDFLSPWEGAQSLLPGDEKAEKGV